MDRRKRIIVSGGAGVVILLIAVVLYGASGRGNAAADSGDLVPEKELRSVRAALPGAPEGGAGTIDLLDQVDVPQDALAGIWGFQGRALITPATEYGRLQIPVAPPEEYDLSIVLTRKRGVHSFNIGFLLGGRQAMIAIDTNEGKTSCLCLAGGSDPFDNETRFEGKNLKWNKKGLIKVFVRKDSVNVTVDEHTVVSWKGSPAALDFPPGWSVTNPKALFIGSWDSVFRIDEMTLTPLGGSAATVLRQKRAS